MNEIGEILKKARVEKGYTLDDLQQTTKIQKRYLEAIENGETDILPGRFYARAFVRQYADIVGLDGEALLDEYYQVSAEEVNEEFAESISTSPTRTQGKQESFLSGISEQLPTIFIFLLVAAILFIIYIAFTFRQTTPANKDETPIISEENTEQVTKPDAEETNEAEEEATEMEEDEEEEVEEQEIIISSSTGSTTNYEIKGPHPEEQAIVLTASGGDSWVSIQVQGGASDAGLLSDGESMTVDFGADVDRVDLVIGNASFTKISLNDTELSYSPESEGIVKQDLTLEFVE